MTTLCDELDKPAKDENPILAQIVFTSQGFRCDADMEFINFLEKKIHKAPIGMEKLLHQHLLELMTILCCMQQTKKEHKKLN